SETSCRARRSDHGDADRCRHYLRPTTCFRSAAATTAYDSTWRRNRNHSSENSGSHCPGATISQDRASRKTRDCSATSSSDASGRSRGTGCSHALLQTKAFTVEAGHSCRSETLLRHGLGLVRYFYDAVRPSFTRFSSISPVRSFFSKPCTRLLNSSTLLE